MGLEGITQSKISQTEKDKNYIVVIYMWNLKNKQINKQKTVKLIEVESKSGSQGLGKLRRGWLKDTNFQL